MTFSTSLFILFVCVTTKPCKWSWLKFARRASFAKFIRLVIPGLPPSDDYHFLAGASLLVHVVVEKFDIWDVYIGCRTEPHLHIMIFFFFFVCAQIKPADRQTIYGGWDFSDGSHPLAQEEQSCT